MTQSDQQFEELMIPRKEFNYSSAMLYRIYSDHKNYEVIEAASALDAMAQSKIKNVYKIMRHDPLGDNVIHFNNPLNSNKQEAQSSFHPEIELPESVAQPVIHETAAKPAEEVVAAAEPQAAQAPAQPEEAAALSNEDIDKLLNG